MVKGTSYFWCGTIYDQILNNVDSNSDSTHYRSHPQNVDSIGDKLNFFATLIDVRNGSFYFVTVASDAEL
jgi:hypothetical protein